MPAITRRGLVSGLTVIALLLALVVVPYAGAVDYTYDDLNRLIHIDYGNGTTIDYTYDEAGNRLTVNTQQPILLPATAASPAGRPFNTSQSVTLTCSDPQGPGCDKIYYTTDGTTPTTASSIYTSPITISTTTTLKFFSRDLNGNSGPVQSQTYTLDTTAPTGTVTINAGANSTTSPTVTLTLSCTDPVGCSQMQFSNDNVTYSAPESYSATRTWTLAPWDGNETVYVKVKDAAGNWSTVYSYTIVLHNTNPNPAPVRIANTNYGTVQNAYDAAQDGALIQCRGITYTESLTMDRNISVTLAGGYDDGFTTNTGGLTALKGTIITTAGGGTLTIGNFVLQQ